MREGAKRGVPDGDATRILRAVCLVAHQRTDRAGSSRTLSGAPRIAVPVAVRKLDAVEGNRLPKESLSSWLRKLDTIEGNRLLRACRKRLRMLARCQESFTNVV
jgi:hypothetical protein